MRSKILGASLTTKAVIAVVLVGSLSGIAVGVGQASGAASSPATGATVKTHPQAAGTAENAIFYFAAREKGVPNCGGGNGWYGPVKPANSGCTAPGFGCMSLAQFAVYQGTDGKVKLPGDGSQLKDVGTYIKPPASGNPWAGLRPGDVTYWGGSIGAYQHSGVYAGNGEVWDAVGNDTVGLRSFTTLLTTWGYPYEGAIRYAAAPLLSITTGSLPAGTVYTSSNVAYSAKLQVAAGRAPYRWSLADGSLPTGLAISTTGVISGRATETGIYTFSARVSDTKTSTLVQASVTKSLSIRIN